MSKKLSLSFLNIMTPNKRFYELDALRGLAAVSVCLFHFSLFKYGCVGVDLFFIISGFVIFMTLANSENIKRFWQLRLIRLFPSYWLSIVLVILCSLFFNKSVATFNINFWAGNITMLQPIFRVKYISGVYWTLYVEMLFYLLITLLWRSHQFKNISLIILIGLITVVVINGLHLYFNSGNITYTRFFVVIRSLLPLLSHWQFFSAGILFYISYNEGLTSGRAALLFFTIVATAVGHNDSVMINSFLNVKEHIVCDLIIYGFLFLVFQNKVIFLQNKWLSTLGDISYPLYLIHSAIGLNIRDYFTPILGYVLSVLVALIFTFLISFLMTYCFDIPVRKWLKSKLLFK